MDPVDRSASARTGDQGQRGIAADPVVSAEGFVGAADRRAQPDRLGDRRAGGVIFADEAPVGIVDEAVRGRSAGDRDPLVEPVTGVGLRRIAGAGVAREAAIAVVARRDADAAGPRLGCGVAAAVIGDRPRPRGIGQRGEPVGSAGIAVALGAGRRRSDGQRGEAQPVVGVVAVVSTL